MACDTLRTFHGVPLLIKEHLQRLENGCRLLGFGISTDEFEAAILQLLKLNRERVDAEGDFRISLIATPGVPGSGEATCVATLSRLDLPEIARRYREGISLALVSIREISASSIPRSLKHRNRIHYWLAEQEASRTRPGSQALMLDENGSVCETTTAAIGFFPDSSTFVAPDERDILRSISLEKSMEFLRISGYRTERTRFAVEDLLAADEVLWFNALTPVAPVSQLLAGVSQREFAVRQDEGEPGGPGYRLLIDAWSQFAGFDLERQAAKSVAF